MYYLIVVTAVAAVIRFAPKRIGATIGAVALLVQLVDLSPRYLGLRDYFMEHYVNLKAMQDVSLHSPQWEAFGKRYTRVSVVPMEYIAPNYLRLGLYAADHGMSINVGHFARIDGIQLAPRAATLLDSLKKGELDPNALYVINDESIRSSLTKSDDDALLKLDGMYVLAPRWK